MLLDVVSVQRQTRLFRLARVASRTVSSATVINGQAIHVSVGSLLDKVTRSDPQFELLASQPLKPCRIRETCSSSCVPLDLSSTSQALSH